MPAKKDIDSWKSNKMSEGNIENISRSGSNFAPILVDLHVLPDKNFNWHYSINYNISIPKKVINLIISYTLSSWFLNRYLNRFYIKVLLIWICKANVKCWSR